jgi:hypothetical protein
MERGSKLQRMKSRLETVIFRCPQQWTNQQNPARAAKKTNNENNNKPPHPPQCRPGGDARTRHAHQGGVGGSERIKATRERKK